MSVTPQFIGQTYQDTITGNIWKANSITTGDWSLLLQNMQVSWTPGNFKLGEMVGFFAFGDLPGITNIQFLGTTAIAGFDIESTNITKLEWPNLVTI